MADPRPVSDVDEDAQNALRLSVRFIYTLMISMGVLVIVLGCIVGVLAVRAIGEHGRTEAQINQAVRQVDQEVTTQCGFDYPVADAPVSVAKTSKLGFLLVVGARNAVIGLDCPQHLAPPPKELTQLGKKYGVPVR